MGPASDDVARQSPSPDELYRVAVEEYRFQAQFNWSRVQYLLAFNAAILATSVGLTSTAGAYASLLYVLGAIAASLTLLVVRAQHDYYRAARDRMRRFEEQFRIHDRVQIDTTSTLGDRSRIVSVNQVVTLLLLALITAHVVGLVLLVAS